MRSYIIKFILTTCIVDTPSHCYVINYCILTINNFNLNHAVYKGEKHMYLVVSLHRKDLEDNICYEHQLQ